MMRRLLLLASFLVLVPAVAQAESSHQWSAYVRGGVGLHLSDARTIGGLGLGLGVRDTIDERFVLQGDATYHFMVGNSVAMRLGAGVQRSGMWIPAALVTANVMVGDQLSFLRPEYPTPVSFPSVSLGLALAPLRFRAHGTTVNIGEVTIGVAHEFPGWATVFQVALLEIASEF